MILLEGRRARRDSRAVRRRNHTSVPNQLIAWKTLTGAPVAHTGIVRLDPISDGHTRVHIRMSYN